MSGRFAWARWGRCMVECHNRQLSQAANQAKFKFLPPPSPTPELFYDFFIFTKYLVSFVFHFYIIAAFFVLWFPSYAYPPQKITF